MGLNHSPRIVTNGLVFAVDAGNTKSYPGTGTTWSDLSGNGKTGTLNNGPTYDSGNGGSIVFDGTDDTVSVATPFTSPAIPTGTSSRTLIACFKTPSSITGLKQHVLHYGSAATDQAYGIVLVNQSGFTYIGNHTWSGGSYCTNITISTSTIYFVVLTYNNSSSPRNTYYINGVAGTTGYTDGKTVDYAVNTGSGGFNFGVRISPPEYFKGNIYLAQVYNRDLSAAEIQQNFNALRGRYGL